MTFPDPANSRAVLIGNGSYTDHRLVDHQKVIQAGRRTDRRGEPGH